MPDLPEIYVSDPGNIFIIFFWTIKRAEFLGESRRSTPPLFFSRWILPRVIMYIMLLHSKTTTPHERLIPEGSSAVSDRHVILIDSAQLLTVSTRAECSSSNS
jgi:hypothetical protein